MTDFVKFMFVRCISIFTIVLLTVISCNLPANARFISPGTWDPTKPGVGTNRYAYSENDPVNKSDPNGHDSFGSGNPYQGYDIDRDGYSQFVGGWNYSTRSGIGVRDSHNDPLGYGGSPGFNATFPNGMSVPDKMAGVADVFSRGNHPEFGVHGTFGYSCGEMGGSVL
ncbi:hypothetical protein [Rhizobium esperanzae]|uniref:Uncharacterized protein n=1 Tax=Rhizobium esperanzae TaxID=1967781 RepID=A0A7W6W640_9HYPH|nr:hypothetical protein [Rhizobium esperanzae]MBB4236966.1 hypothetical protein [Rhizobium esperanzae]